MLSVFGNSTPPLPHLLPFFLLTLLQLVDLRFQVPVLVHQGVKLRVDLGQHIIYYTGLISRITGLLQ